MALRKSTKRESDNTKGAVNKSCKIRPGSRKVTLSMKYGCDFICWILKRVGGGMAEAFLGRSFWFAKVLKVAIIRYLQFKKKIRFVPDNAECFFTFISSMCSE